MRIIRLEGKVPKNENICVEHQFCFCKECVILGARNKDNVTIKNDFQQSQDAVHKVSCGSMVRKKHLKMFRVCDKCFFFI